MVCPPNRVYFLRRVQGTCQAWTQACGAPSLWRRQMRMRAGTLCSHEARLVPTLGGGKARWGRNNGKSWSNPSWFFAVVSLTLAHFLHGYEGQRHRKRGALTWRALDINGPTVGHDNFTHDVEPQTCPFLTCTIQRFKKKVQLLFGDGTASISYLDDTMGGSAPAPEGHGAALRHSVQRPLQQIHEGAL